MSGLSLRSLLNEQLNEILVSEILILDVLPMIESKLYNTQFLSATNDLKKLMRNQQSSIQKILNKVSVKFKRVRLEKIETLMAEMVSLSEFSDQPKAIDMQIAFRFRKLHKFQSVCYGAAGIYASSLGYKEISHDLARLVEGKDVCFNVISEIAEDLERSISDNQ